MQWAGRRQANRRVAFGKVNPGSRILPSILEIRVGIEILGLSESQTNKISEKVTRGRPTSGSDIVV